MPLLSLSIYGYRGFQSKQTINFSVPSGEIGSGLTIITGMNNSGKSSILEALRARSGYESISFPQGVRNVVADEVLIEYNFENIKETLYTTEKGSSETRRKDINSEMSIFVLPSRRAFNPYFHRSVYNRSDYLRNSPLPPNRSSTLSNFEYRLFNILADRQIFDELLERCLGFKPIWTIDQTSQGSYYLKFFNDEQHHSSDGMGEGIVSIFAIADALYDSSPGDMIVIDEPELSLHPGLQKRVARVISDFSADRQLVIATHSPYFIDLNAIGNGAYLSRISGNSKHGTEIHQLSDEGRKSAFELSGKNLNNPHVFGLDAKELFFQEDKIVLTEGQEDVIFYPKVIEQIGGKFDGSFFGWGVGGAANMPRLAKILRDLGFKKVVGLLDADKKEMLPILRSEFPGFHFDAIPALDIRTKPARKEMPEVEGLLDKKGFIRDVFKDETSHLIEAARSYFEKVGEE